MTKVTAIIPTFNNPEQVSPCIYSLIGTGFLNVGKIVVVNNGDGQLNFPQCTTINTGENLGWERGLMAGLPECDTEHVLFMNDDTFIPASSAAWIHYLLEIMDHDASVGAVGPTSNVVRAWQNIFSGVPHTLIDVEYLIGFCMLIRKSAFDAAGGIDTTLPGGDDLDLSIRLKDAGYKLIIDRKSFVYHHGFGTGIRLHGDHTVEGGWNSRKMSDETNMALIRKHGLYRWWVMMRNVYHEYRDIFQEDIEGKMIRNLIGENGKRVLELGCGNNRTVPNSVCVDKYNQNIADVMADVSEPLPFDDGEFDILIGRHILEHLENPGKVLSEWNRVLSREGKMILALPYTKYFYSDPTHKTMIEPIDAVNFMKGADFQNVNLYDSGNDISFVVEASRA